MLVGNKNDLHMERCVLKQTQTVQLVHDTQNTWVKASASLNDHFYLSLSYFFKLSVAEMQN